MPATIRDVAERAGVGLGTVSRVLNNNPGVSPLTRERVLKVIEELGFVPSPTARRLSTGKMQLLVVIAPFFTRPSSVERLRAVELKLAERGYDLMVYNVETPAQRSRAFHQVAHPNYADGVLIVSLPPNETEAERLLRAGQVVVLVDTQHPKFISVYEDSRSGGRLATEHLLQLGHKRIAYVCDLLDKNPFGFRSSTDRMMGYKEALLDANIQINPDYIVEGEHSVADACAATHQLLDLPTPPTAIFAASDTQAAGVREAVLARGLSVPEDISIVGYDDIELAHHLNLTTVRQNLALSGERGVKLLVDALLGELKTPVHEMLPVELVVRGSAAPAKQP